MSTCREAQVAAQVRRGLAFRSLAEHGDSRRARFRRSLVRFVRGNFDEMPGRPQSALLGRFAPFERAR